ncbi:MAG: hypothetical protein IT494_03195, partial [Gammaproteobacteria bacterium]|nr:hypothetical protein [Gammaproteobacteria bacterium]
NAIDRVPFFSEIPYLGQMFRRTVSSHDKQELLVFVTPRILKEGLTVNR